MDAGTVVVAGIGVAGTVGGSAISYAIARSAAREETARLRAQYREEERRNRQGTYHRLYAVLQELSARPSVEDMERLLREWWFASAGVYLFGSRDVATHLAALSGIIAAKPDIRDEEEWTRQFAKAGGPLLRAMREDVGAPGD